MPPSGIGLAVATRYANAAGCCIARNGRLLKSIATEHELLAVLQPPCIAQMMIPSFRGGLVKMPADWSASNLIKAPAVGAAVRSALPGGRRADALGKSLRAFLNALDHAFILVGKFDWPPGLACRCSCLLSRLLLWRDARQQKKHGDSTGQAHKHGFASSRGGFLDIASTAAPANGRLKIGRQRPRTG
jgi:hypothetical protein